MTSLQERVSLAVAGEPLELLADRALWWPAERALVVADLHLGKEAAFRRSGIAVPTGTLAGTLARLDALLDITAAERLLVLGDLIHNHAGLTVTTREAVASWRRRRPVPLWLVQGNHDRAIGRVAEDWALTLLGDALDAPPLRLVHAPEACSAAGVLAGHLHPVTRLGRGADRMRLPCFHLCARSQTLVLPAFSRFTGGALVAPGPGDVVVPVVEEGGVARGLLVPRNLRGAGGG